MKLYYRIIRFISMCAWDLLIHDKVAKVLGNFYECFLVADFEQQRELLDEARRLTASEVDGVVDAVMAGWKSRVLGGKVTETLKEIVRQLVVSLKAAGEPSAAANPSEALRKSLNDTITLRGEKTILPLSLKPDQLAVGRTMVLAGLMRERAARVSRELPADAPQIPGYQLLGVVGDGGFSRVYLGTNLKTGERRAIKVGPLDDNARFEREARMLASLQGPYVVRYHEHGTIDGRYWIAMEYLGEFTLADLIATNPSAEVGLLLAGQLLRGLEGLHKAGVIHRDLKPDNAMVDASFQLKLIDFGLAKPLPGSKSHQIGTMTVGLTVTPRYMAPELIDEEKASPAADIWAFGCVLYELLTGSPLFDSKNIMALSIAIKHKELAFDQLRIPEEIRPFLSRCLNRTASERWINAGEALPEFTRVAAEIRRRLRHERFRSSWGLIIEKGLLERFAAAHKGKIPDGAVSLFADFASREGIWEVDEERIGEVLEPIFTAMRSYETANAAVAEAKSSLQRELLSLTGEQSARRSARIHELEKVARARLGEVQGKVRELLSKEIQGWTEGKSKLSKFKTSCLVQLDRLAEIWRRCYRFMITRSATISSVCWSLMRRRPKLKVRSLTVAVLFGVCFLMLSLAMLFANQSYTQPPGAIKREIENEGVLRDHSYEQPPGAIRRAIETKEKQRDHF